METSSSIGLELTQFMHPNLQLVEDIIQQAAIDAGINKDIKKNYLSWHVLSSDGLYQGKCEGFIL